MFIKLPSTMVTLIDHLHISEYLKLYILLQLFPFKPVSYGISNPMEKWPRGHFSFMVYWTSLLKTDPPPLYGKLNPHGISPTPHG